MGCQRRNRPDMTMAPSAAASERAPATLVTIAVPGMTLTAFSHGSANTKSQVSQ
jgi:hypothetical protein